MYSHFLNKYDKVEGATIIRIGTQEKHFILEHNKLSMIGSNMLTEIMRILAIYAFPYINLLEIKDDSFIFVHVSDTMFSNDNITNYCINFVVKVREHLENMWNIVDLHLQSSIVYGNISNSRKEHWDGFPIHFSYYLMEKSYNNNIVISSEIHDNLIKESYQYKYLITQEIIHFESFYEHTIYKLKIYD